MKPEATRWLVMAEQDLAAAEVLFGQQFFPATVFHAHAAMEKLLKALWIENNAGDIPPQTHDLILIATQAGTDLPDWRTFLADLSDQSVASRYAGLDTYTQANAERYIEQVKELWQLLRVRLN